MKTVTLLLATTIMIAANVSPAFAAPDNRDVVRDRNGQIIRNTFGYCVRTKWVSETDACAPAAAPAPKAQVERRVRVSIAQEERTVYFPFNKATLTDESKAKLDSLADTLKSDDQVKEARIVGYADRIGTTSYNDKLSQKRAGTVKNYLVSRGFVNSSVAETRWFGESVPATSCPDTLSRPALIECLQKDRRVELEIDYLPESPPYPAKH